jgi:hypothetical protein
MRGCVVSCIDCLGTIARFGVITTEWEPRERTVMSLWLTRPHENGACLRACLRWPGYFQRKPFDPPGARERSHSCQGGSRWRSWRGVAARERTVMSLWLTRPHENGACLRACLRWPGYFQRKPTTGIRLTTAGRSSLRGWGGDVGDLLVPRGSGTNLLQNRSYPSPRPAAAQQRVRSKVDESLPFAAEIAYDRSRIAPRLDPERIDDPRASR